MKKKILSMLLIATLILTSFACTKNVEKTLTSVVAETVAQTEFQEISDTVKKVYADSQIGLKSVKNARQLGGFTTKDGRKVKSNLLFRSGHLGRVSDEDMEVLKSFNIKNILDFRTMAEMASSPDMEINGIKSEKVAIIEEFDLENDPVLKNMKSVTGDTSADMMVAYYEHLGTLDDMYEGIVRGPRSYAGYRRFFDVLLSNDGATLWHCSSGKDRTGFAAVYLLHILGVDRKTILDDYEASNVFYENSMKKTADALKEKGYDEKDINEIVKLVGIDRKVMEKMLDIIDNEYGGLDKYLKEKIGITEDEMQKLRDKYLEYDSKGVNMGNVKAQYLGHGSLKIYFDDKVCYIDPYAGDDYNEKADIILITHQHSDHNDMSLVKQNEGCKVYQNFDAIGDNGYNSTEFYGMKIEPVEAYNKNHKKEECVGYVLRVNGKVIYVAGDTSKTKQMETLSGYNIDYAFLPMDGMYNMDIEEAIECEKLIGAKHTIPYHMAPGKLFDEERAKAFDTRSTMIVKPGETIDII